MNQVYLEGIKRTKGDEIDRHVHLEHGNEYINWFHFHINKHSEYGSWQVNVTLGWLRCLVPQAGHLMRLKEVKGTCFVKK